MLALRNGITTLGDLYVDQSFLRDIQRFNAAGQLRVRTGLYLVYNDPCGRQIGTWYKSYPPTRTPGEMLRINGVKIFTDGGSCGHVALSFDYDDHGLGDLWMTQEVLNNAVAEAQTAGYQVAIHAIGDRAVAQGEALFGSAIAHRLMTFFSSLSPAPTSAPPLAFPELTEREREVLSLIAQGHNNAEIAERLTLSPKTVGNHISNIFSKLQVADRAQAIVRARAAGLGI